MTSHRAFKARVRARMTKTGESYTTARRHLLTRVAAGTRAPADSDPAHRGAATAAAPDDPSGATTDPATIPRGPAARATAEHGTAGPDPTAAVAGQRERIPDALLRERTGRGWDEWFALLDDENTAGRSGEDTAGRSGDDTAGRSGAGTADARTHGEIAAWLVTTHRVPGWWAQTVTVGYEQARGLRAPGQGRDGGYSTGGSRTVAVPVERLFDAFADEALRARWLPEVEVRVRTATAPRTFRADWAGGPTRIVVGFVAVGPTKSKVTVQHEKVTDPRRAADLKAYWRDRLAALKQLLETDGDPR
ncbi:hypothetical protein [Micromonospora endolithica]|uniref:DUF4287 domain-containing protein n=1 Tax=Micromonospora endolithica TaxID=230091 RepID=A0A3A9YU93_9ACTN|nr:hypothetical protein [Micromonospora endolithica]RKN39661.1 hypothetical protein D7223_28625 [Micromonospora endolithica]TWJ22195.1 hypothetical protein JD76_02309 [Micromonospora endolithica]